MYEKDGITRAEVVSIVDTFPNQGTSVSYIEILLTVDINACM